MISFVNNNSSNNNTNIKNESNDIRDDKNTDNSNLKLKDVIQEKKRKLTLQIPNTTTFNNNNLASLDNKLPINKRIKTIQQQDVTPTNGHTNILSPLNVNMTNLSDLSTPLNKDLITSADLNLSTPFLDKLIADFGPNFNNIIKTPGSALAILTPNLNNNNNNNGQSQFFILPTPTNTLEASFPTFSIEDLARNNQQSNMNTTNNDNNNLYIPNSANYGNLISFNLNGQATTPILTPTASTLINPTSIFGNQINTQNTLKSGTNSNDLILDNTSNNNNHNNNNLNGNNIFILQPANTNTLGTTSQMKIKDELQTVPIHGTLNAINNNFNNVSKLTSVNKLNSKNNKNNNGKIKNLESSNNNNDITSEKLTKSSHQATQQRRDTDNSTVSSISNVDSSTFSPINLENQEVMKIEKKRERNREAARKCRTRKLEKIAELEKEVHRLSESNQQERVRNRELREEVMRIRKKLEEHQKMNNCDLKANSTYY